MSERRESDGWWTSVRRAGAELAELVLYKISKSHSSSNACGWKDTHVIRIYHS